MIPRITSGVVAVLILNALPIRPVDMTNQENGLATANTTATGASNLKIGAASIHFAPSTTRTISSANRAQVMVIGIVADMSSEKPLRKDLARRLASCCIRDSAGKATPVTAEFNCCTGRVTSWNARPYSPSASAPQKRPRRSFSAFHARYTMKLLQVANPPKWSIDRMPDLRRGAPGTQGTASHNAAAPTTEMVIAIPTRDQ